MINDSADYGIYLTGHDARSGLNGWNDQLAKTQSGSGTKETNVVGQS